jgi:hypothetical protein
MLCFLLVRRRKKKREREMAGGFFSQGWTCLAGCAVGFLWLLSAVKG